MRVKCQDCDKEFWKEKHWMVRCKACWLHLKMLRTKKVSPRQERKMLEGITTKRTTFLLEPQDPNSDIPPWE